MCPICCDGINAAARAGRHSTFVIPPVRIRVGCNRPNKRFLGRNQCQFRIVSRGLALITGVICVVSFAAVNPARGRGWTRFRGPNGSGQSEATIPAQWTDKDYNWKVELPGVGHSSPVLWGDMIFLTSADPQSGVRFVLALAASDGHVLWKKAYPASLYHIHTQNSFATGTPAADVKHVYVAFATPDDMLVIALDHAGNEVWRRSLGPFESQHGFGCSPVVVGDLVVINDQQDGSEARTGQAAPSSKRKTAKHLSGSGSADEAAELQPSGDDDGRSWIIAARCREGQLCALSGKRRGCRAWSVMPRPIVRRTAGGGSELICDSRSHGFERNRRCNRASQLGASDFRSASGRFADSGRRTGAWSVRRRQWGTTPSTRSILANRAMNPRRSFKFDKASAPYVPTPVAKGNLVFICNDRGIATCIDGTTGKMKWRQLIGGNYQGSPVRAADKIYCTSTDGDVIVLAAADKYEELGRSSLGEATRATPAIAGGRMYLRTESHLFSIGGK